MSEKHHQHPSNRTERLLLVPPERVWEELCDGWHYPLWVVGASRMRDVDATWPEKGSQLHHSVGSWPLLINDTTEVVDVTPGETLVVQARGWPAGEARVTIRLEPRPEGTLVAIEEDASHFPARLVPRPLRAAALRWRNIETLRRLAYLAERRGQES